MIKKIIQEWKQEWWLKHAGQLAQEFNGKHIDLVHRCEEEIQKAQAAWQITKESSLQKIRLEEEEIKYRLESLESRKRELAHLDTDIKNQMKLLEAKANPSFVWESAFTAGATKTWDLIMPLMTRNLEKMMTKIKEDAAIEAVNRLHGKK